jgi:protein-tyrosine phosphatase
LLPLTDIHCHLLAGLDDGPRTDADALAMCRLAYDRGTRHVTALAHQNEDWPGNTPDRIRTAARRLADQLRAEQIGLAIHASAEVMVHAELEETMAAGELLTLADRGQYLLIELPHSLFLDLRELVTNLVERGVRPVLAHPERQPELLHGMVELPRLIRAGCLLQVNAGSVTQPANSDFQRKLRSWFQRDWVHLIGSDGHSLRRRPPLIDDAYRQIANWATQTTADRICSTNGLAILSGLPLTIRKPERPKRRWLARLLR